MPSPRLHQLNKTETASSVPGRFESGSWAWARQADRRYGQTKYEAEAIEHRGGYFYRVGKRVIGIEKWEYERVCEYAVLHYFTTALKLHYRLGLEPGSPLYEVWKAVELPKVN
jgi:hypothetical protein